MQVHEFSELLTTLNSILTLSKKFKGRKAKSTILDSGRKEKKMTTHSLSYGKIKITCIYVPITHTK